MCEGNLSQGSGCRSRFGLVTGNSFRANEATAPQSSRKGSLQPRDSDGLTDPELIRAGHGVSIRFKDFFVARLRSELLLGDF